ncbi:MAG: asparagine synthase (glutamine-hydrolyzing) [Clostridia bacterium]|nr:asparagine synthase (glutamine-hydrolyzing) [Clostridia bacterium]
MCGIAGLINFGENMMQNEAAHRLTVFEMAEVLTPRGPDSCGEWVGEHAAFAHRRLAVIDPEKGQQPMKRTVEGHEFVICYNGELYNTAELKSDLMRRGYVFTTECDTEVLLMCYIHYGKACAEKLNGIYAFAVWDSMRQQVFLCRDRFGVKPLFYSIKDVEVIFGSEIKSLLAHPYIKPEVDRDGLCELFAMSPARTAGCGVFRGISELKPAHSMIISRNGIKDFEYWSLASREHTDSYEDTVLRVRELLEDAIKRQLISDVPIGTLLSGGLDSSVITAVAAREMGLSGKTLSTYSFDYVGNDRNFKATAFQPDSDTPWSERVSRECGTNHTVLQCSRRDLADLLYPALYCKDLPGMADVDASLYYYCREIKKNHTVLLSGECSDEIFGGYPWFRDEKAFATPHFPWCYDLSLRKSVLKDEVAATLDLDAYSQKRYDESVGKTPRFDGDSTEEARRREIAYLNIVWFMSNLLDRKDRMSMASGLEVRVPFCDYRLVEYVWNIPWEYKNKGNVSKSILREAARGLLSDDVLFRKKSPYPKTHDPEYEKEVKARLADLISDPNTPLTALCDKRALTALTKDGASDYGKPFFGQLMAMPQFIGYLLQIDEWFRHYKVRIV